jgi:PAS domain S-box-containing protein
VLAVLLIALGWGAGPGLFATLLGAVLLNFVTLPDALTWVFDTTGDVLSTILFLLVGFIISVIASSVEHARRKSERLALLLNEEQTQTEMERKRLNAMMEVLPIGMVLADEQGKFLRFNQASEVVWGKPTPSPQEIAEYEAYKGWWPDTGQPLAPEDWMLVRAVNRGEVCSGTEVEIETFDGQRKVAFFTAAPIRDDSGVIIGGVATVMDISERKRLEQRTRDSLQALLAMAEALVQTPTIPASPGQGTGSAASLAAHRLAELVSNLLGCASVSIAALDLERGVSQPLAVLGLPPDQEQRWWAGERRSARWMDGTHTEVLARLQAGETLALDMTSPLLRDEPNPYRAQFFLAIPMRIGERLVGLMILNPKGEPPRYFSQEIALAEAAAKLGALVIERERLLRERQAAQANELALLQANQQMDGFLGIASHELKTPLTTVLLGLQLSQRRLQRLLREESIANSGASEKLEAVNEQLTITGRQAIRLDRLVNDLLDVSRIQADKLVFRLEPADLATLICEVVQEQRQSNPQRRIQVEMPPCLSAPVCADAGRIEQVLTNYLTNALKYSPDDTPVEVGAARETDALRVWVRDYGPGISAAQQEHIWERFHRVPGVEICSGSGVGLGLGLYISRAIIERHHGQVGVKSCPGEGSTFWFTLPLLLHQEEALGDEAQDASRS